VSIFCGWTATVDDFCGNAADDPWVLASQHVTHPSSTATAFSSCSVLSVIWPWT